MSTEGWMEEMGRALGLSGGQFGGRAAVLHVVVLTLFSDWSIGGHVTVWWEGGAETTTALVGRQKVAMKNQAAFGIVACLERREGGREGGREGNSMLKDKGGVATPQTHKCEAALRWCERP